MTLEELQAAAPGQNASQTEKLAWIDRLLNLGAPGIASATQQTGIKAAGEVQSAAYDRIIPMLQEQQGRISGQFAPFSSAGVAALPELQQGFQTPQGTTAGGLDEILNQIMGGEAFGGLKEERMRSLQGQLGASGLRRSGVALEEAAALPTDLAFQLENLLTGRQFEAEGGRMSALENLVSTGQGAVSSETAFSNNILAQIMNAITGQSSATATSLMSAAEASANETLARAERNAAERQNTLNTLTTIGSWGFSDVFDDD